MTDSTQYRVRYHAGQTLRRQDFEDEQKYHRGLLQSHNKHQHRPGVLEGLNLSFDKEEMRFKVQEGKAIGKDGTFIVLDKTWPIEIRTFDEKGRDRLDVYLEHSDPLDTQDSLPKQYTRCQIPQAETDSRQAIKVRVAVKELQAKPQRADAIYLGRLIRDFSSAEVAYIADMRERENAGLVGAVISSPSGKARIELGTYEGTDDRRFAVFLADPSDLSTCSTQASENAGNHDSAALEIRAADEHCAIDLRGKVTVTGDLFVRQGALAFLQGHANAAKDNADAATKVAEWLYQEPDLKVSEALRKFRELVDPAIPPAQAGGGRAMNAAEDGQSSQLDRKWMEELLRSRAHRTLGELLQELAAILSPSTANVGESSPSPAPEDAQRIPRPWTVYRAQSHLDSSSGGGAGIPQVPTEQLRVELNAERDSAFVVGSFPADGEQFKPILTVRSKPANGNETLGQVVVKGDLIVEGRIEGKREEPVLSDRARELLFSGALLGPQNAEALIAAFERTGFLPELKVLKNLPDEVGVLQTVVNAVLTKKVNGLNAIANAIHDTVPVDVDMTKLAPVAEVIMGKDQGANAIATKLPDDDTGGKLTTLAQAIMGKASGDEVVAGVLPDDDTGGKLTTLASALVKKSAGPGVIARTLDDGQTRDLAAAIMARNATFSLAIAESIPDAKTKLQHFATQVMTRSKVVEEEVITQIVDGLANNYLVSPDSDQKGVEDLALLLAASGVPGNPEWKNQLAANL